MHELQQAPEDKCPQASPLCVSVCLPHCCCPGGCQHTCKVLLHLPTSAQTHTAQSYYCFYTNTRTHACTHSHAITCLPTGTHEHKHTMCNHLLSFPPSHLYTINSIYQEYCNSNITGGASIKTNKLHPCAALTVSLSP